MVKAKQPFEQGDLRLIARPRVDAVLADAVRKGAVVVHAGGGFGKTKTVSRYLADTEYRTVWMRLSPLDNLPTRFWENLTGVFAAHRPRLAEKMARLGFPSTIHMFDVFLSDLACELYHDARFVPFVFDDLQLIEEPAVLDFISNLISTRMENCSIILLTRAWPVFPKRPGTAVQVITADTLSFNLEETERLIQAYGVEISPEHTAQLLEYVSGWPIAVSVALMMLGRTSDARYEMEKLSNTKLALFRLFEQEIFLQYTPKERDLLIKLSELESLPRGLIHAVTGEAGRDTAHLLSNNLFIRYDTRENRLYFPSFIWNFSVKSSMRSVLKKEIWRSGKPRNGAGKTACCLTR